MSEELKKCPFCPDGIDIKLFGGPEDKYMQCQECGAIGPGNAETEAEAITFWNKRADSRVAELEEIEEQFKNLQMHHRNAIETMRFMNLKIKRLEAQTRWIPVSERLPKAGKQVFMMDSDTRYVYVGSMNKPKEWWYYCVNTEKTITEKDITHWKPITLPK